VRLVRPQARHTFSISLLSGLMSTGRRAITKLLAGRS
jgi:hypothetical protein